MATTPAETTYAIAQCIHEEWQLQKDRNDRVAAWTGHKVCRSSNRTTAHPPIAHCRASPSPARGSPPTEVRSRTAGCGDLPRILRQDGPTINDHFSEIKEGEMVYGGQLVDKIRQATKAPSSKAKLPPPLPLRSIRPPRHPEELQRTQTTAVPTLRRFFGRLPETTVEGCHHRFPQGEANPAIPAKKNHGEAFPARLEPLLSCPKKTARRSSTKMPNTFTKFRSWLKLSEGRY